MLNLMTTFFEPKTKERLEEFEFCIKTDCENNLVDKFFIFYENLPKNAIEIHSFLNNKKIKLIDIKNRPMYKDFINYASYSLQNSLIGIINTDVYFDDSLKYLEKINFENTLCCVTRIIEKLDTCYKYQNPGSHDAWFFKIPIIEFVCDIAMGICGCDSYFAQKASEAGMRVINPCLSLHVFHNHKSNERNDHKEDKDNYWAYPDYKYFEVPYST